MNNQTIGVYVNLEPVKEPFVDRHFAGNQNGNLYEIDVGEEIVDAVAKDGSAGVHAPNYTKGKVDEAKLLATGARVVAQGGAADKVASKK